MLWFWCKMLLIALGLFILITILNAVSGESGSGNSGSGTSKSAGGKKNYWLGEKKYRVAAQYRKERIQGRAYLYRIRPKKETDSENEIPILLEFSCGDEQFFLLRSRGRSKCIRKYTVSRSEVDRIKRYMLLDVDEPWRHRLLSNCTELNDYCRKHYAVSAQDLPINFADDAWIELSTGIIDFSKNLRVRRRACRALRQQLRARTAMIPISMILIRSLRTSIPILLTRILMKFRTDILSMNLVN